MISTLRSSSGDQSKLGEFETSRFINYLNAAPPHPPICSCVWLCLIEVTSYKYLIINIHHKLNWNYSIEKRINGGWKAFLVLKITVNQPISSCGIKRSSFFKVLSSMLSCMVVKYGGATFLEKLGGRLSKHKCFITYNLKIKSNTPYLIILIKVGLCTLRALL